ncbi:phosphoenolpyruvate--protein phosphotransferase [Sutterella sp.]|uniref:phosphoenolpyruvate--protein phosphotransferase n=1 Tax=Sutterella sp. TaxID=1981025 RepID=UPI0026E0B028|nr:phosphoenolpyruvate--protein phosphotransferase [Sutterella sp.]MDO5530402.1 phosphoenolpyruvate--protein phosphotransferase [Sutterella sp.]
MTSLPPDEVLKEPAPAPAEAEAAPVAVTEEPLPRTLKGLRVCPGVAYGTGLQLSSSDLEIPQFPIAKEDVRGEIQRLRYATTAVDKQLSGISETLDEDAPAEAAAFIDVYRTILQDPSLITETSALIREKLVNAEWALSQRLEQIRRDFEQIDNDYLRNRIEDISDVFQRIQRVLAGRRSAASLLEADELEVPVILVADQLGPADMLQLRERDDLDIVGIVMETGSVTSHSAILASSFGIPTLVGVADALERIGTGREVLIDADKGEVRLEPSVEEKKTASRAMRALKQRKRSLVKLKSEAAVTLDGQTVALYANIALPDDTAEAKKAGADGIGLFRTEFLFLNREDLPNEEEQVEAYQKVIRAMRGRMTTIRTADLGGDKMLSNEALVRLHVDLEKEENPALGLRALRFSFAFKDLFITQLRALMRAAVAGDVRILLPMVSSPTDVHEVRECMAEAARQLTAEGLKYRDDIPLGGMIELPATVAVLADLIPLLDFFSLGTNDLVQYTLAVDRTNARVSRYYDECHPAVLRLIADSIRRVLAAGKEISVCGEMGARRDLTPFFIGLGCSALSMDPAHIPTMKERILALRADECEVFARGLLRRRSAESVHEALHAFSATLQPAQAVPAPAAPAAPAASAAPAPAAPAAPAAPQQPVQADQPVPPAPEPEPSAAS